MIGETHKLYDNQTVIDHYNKGYEERESMCPPAPGLSVMHNRWSHKLLELSNKYDKRCKVSELLADEFAVGNISSVPTERTQTPEEALELSIWSPYSTFNLSALRFCWTTNYISILCLLARLSWTRLFAVISSLSVQRSLPGFGKTLYIQINVREWHLCFEVFHPTSQLH